MEMLPSTVFNEEILGRLDLQTLSTLACLIRSFRLLVYSQALPSLTAFHFTTMSPDGETLKRLNSLTLNCLRLQDHPLSAFLSPTFQELNLWCCSSLSYRFLAYIAQHCSNLRVLMLQLADKNLPDIFRGNLALMLKQCLYLESLSLKIRGPAVDASSFGSIELLLPGTVKTLKLQPVPEEDAIRIIRTVGRNLMETEILSIPAFPFCKLRGLSFVLDVTTDQLLITITKSVPFLVELDLEDRPKKEPVPNHHLTNNGLQYLGFCQYLTALSLVQSRLKHQGAFKRVNDMGMFLLSEGCKGLEAVTLCGFSNVSDAGFAAILHVCQKLNKFEVRNALFLSDVAFHDLMDIPCALVEVRLLSCPLITSETVKKVASSKSLEVLDLGGCKSIADSCLCSISCLSKLTELNLTGADITDSGLSVLSQGSIPIRNLCLRGCKRVTDKGISRLLCGRAIGQTLTALDLGYMAGATDKTILTVAAACAGIIDLCIRSCFYVTDSSMEVLARKRTFQDGSERLRRLDVCNCICLSADSLRWFKRLSLRGLQWLGIGKTRLASQENVSKIYEERPWLTLCLDGCEMGCQDGWHFHSPLKSFILILDKLASFTFVLNRFRSLP